MKKILSYFSYLPKKPLLIVMGVLLAATLTATAVAEWGPDRPTKPYSDGVAGFDYVTFNSFTGVPGIGDERQFYNGQYPGQTNFTDPLDQLRAGDEMLMHVYIHNGADDSLNASGEGIARDVNVKVDLPQTTAQSAQSRATISASNASPTAVWDTVDFAAENGGFFELDYIEGSAQLVGNGPTVSINDSLITTGVNIGDVEGCFEQAVAVTYRVKVKQPNYEITKQVAIPGEDWTEEVTQSPGDETSWLIEFKNIGQLPLTNVMLVDNLPPHTTVVPGSVQVFNGGYPDGYTYPDTAIQNNGKQINVGIGDFTPGGPSAFVKFKTTINNNEIFACATTRLQNVAYATPEGYSPVNDSAYVLVVDEVCDQPFIRCEVLNASIINKATRTIEVAADVEKSDDITVTGYEFNWGDGKTDTSSSNVARHSYAKDGKYTVVATINYEGGETTSVTCQTTIDFVKGVVTPPTPPTQPKALPVTGPGEIVASLFGTGTLAGATHMWVNSRRALKAKLLG